MIDFIRKWIIALVYLFAGNIVTIEKEQHENDIE